MDAKQSMVCCIKHADNGRDGVILIECNKIIISVCFGINWEWDLIENTHAATNHLRIPCTIFILSCWSLSLFIIIRFLFAFVFFFFLCCLPFFVSRQSISNSAVGNISNDIQVEISSRRLSTGLFIAALRYPIFMADESMQRWLYLRSLCTYHGARSHHLSGS